MNKEKGISKYGTCIRMTYQELKKELAERDSFEDVTDLIERHIAEMFVDGNLCRFRLDYDAEGVDIWGLVNLADVDDSISKKEANAALTRASLADRKSPKEEEINSLMEKEGASLNEKLLKIKGQEEFFDGMFMTISEESAKTAFDDKKSREYKEGFLNAITKTLDIMGRLIERNVNRYYQEKEWEQNESKIDN